jgi:SH3 domain protein
MRRLIALFGLWCAAAGAGTAYVTDDLVLGVYPEPNGSGARLATLHSGASVETLEAPGGSAEYTPVRLADGRSGWVKSSYLTTRLPATVRVKQLEEELDRSHATTPELAAAAARSEVDSLQHTLAARDAELADARKAAGASTAPARSVQTLATARALALSAIAASLGFAAGYATLARRIKRKYGGLRIYREPCT